MSDNTTERNENKQEAIPVPVLDCDTYREDLAECNFSVEEENEYLATVWDIMRMMVDLNLDMDAVQMLMPPSLCKAFNDEDVEVEQQFNQTEATTEKSNGKRSNHG